MKQAEPMKRGWGTKFTPYTGNTQPAPKASASKAPAPASKSKVGGCTTCGKAKVGAK